MRLKTYFFAPLFSATVLLALVGCSDDLNNKPTDRPEGNGIVFGANASYAGDPDVRTAYGDYENDGSGNRISQEILWTEGDRVEIYSPQSPIGPKVEYGIANIDTQDEGNAYLAAMAGNEGLQWDYSGGVQDFYAVYPSKASMSNQEMAERYVSFENGVLYGFIPTNQQHRIYKGDNGWVAEPNMDWQYMAARINDFTVPATDATDDGGISLKFQPLVTTLEITIKGPSSPLAQMNIYAPEGTTIMGRFKCDLTAGTWGADGTAAGVNTGAPVCESAQTGTTTNYVTVNLYDENNTPLKLEDGESITFNVFMLPVENLTDLEIRIAGFNTASKTLQLDDATTGTKVTLSPHKKTCVTIKAPQAIEGTNTWLEGLNDNVLLTQLSIPGTANSFSYNYTSEQNADRYRTQSASIEEQWNAGIRCFELVCGENGGDVENSPLLCNRHEIDGTTFGQAVKQIWDLVYANDSEFAIIIPSYDSPTGHPGDHNGVENFAEGLNRFYQNHGEYNYQTFSRNSTLGEVRGSLIFIARITSEEDEGYYMPFPVKGTFIDQWGSLKDNWGRRGYALQYDSRANNWSTGENDQNAVEYYMHTTTGWGYGTNNSGNITAPTPDFVPTNSLENDFVHRTFRSDGSFGEAVIQDWVRVVPRDGVVSGLRPGQFYLGYEALGNDYHYYYWPESLTEKEGDIWDTFEASIEENSQSTGGNRFYINSLDGYFVDPDIPLSYTPYVSSGTWGTGLSAGGTEGNILAYANYINDYFYNRILSYGVTNIYGPMNIILMDYVYDGTAGGDRLPSTIINNNFRFPLLVKDDGTSANSADASYSNGGNVWQ